ncbi:5-formyltetrahydrofolate cyclo-ligase [Frigidibacter sp. ROC022]|uniref:5-formyltetrahydrofolate cyclo-ligase n=1 Tax=Frigidibacter sp. ROC022 TaxID=2971796 RepID=UPI00215B5DF3|nr:5-formyltetrahydrofolate cyclo-ligase [Frigidibacter sp. ROC022]MCR8724786.1 5-formyltetrahydrofolate cyclo-ligase [Frigidibacter sp. ROC022]
MDDDDSGGTAPCFAHELVDGQPVDAATARDVARFRKAARERLIASRLALPIDTRTRMAAEVAATLDRLVPEGAIVGLYWPFRGELDLRPWMAAAVERGLSVALPVVVAKATPLVFRRWTPGCAMTRGVWNIPIPAEDLRVSPTVVVSPVVGVDRENYRLGYGGGFYDRTLAALDPRPLVIGIGPELAAIPTIYPQVWDVPMDRVVLA